MKRRKKAAGKSYFSIKLAVISAFSGIAAFFLICCFFSLIFAVFGAAEIIYSGAALTAAAVGAFISGKTGAFLKREKGLITGMLCSLPLFAAELAAFFYIGEEAASGRVVFMFFLTIISGAAGGVYGVNRHIRGLPLIYTEKNRD